MDMNAEAIANFFADLFCDQAGIVPLGDLDFLLVGQDDGRLPVVRGRAAGQPW